MRKWFNRFCFTRGEKICILALAVAIGALFFAAKPLISPTKRIIFPSLESQPADKLYQNKKYGFQFLYSPVWQVEEWNIEEATSLNKLWPDGTILYHGKFFGTSGHFEVLVWENKQSFSSNKSKATLRNWLTWFRHEDLILSSLPDKENYSLVGRPALRYLQQKTSKKKPVLYIFMAKDDKIFELTQEREDLVDQETTQSARFISPIYDQILQSFQFIVQ